MPTATSEQIQAVRKFCEHAKAVEESWGYWEAMTGFPDGNFEHGKAIHGVAPGFISYARRGLYGDALMGIGRLTDPEVMRGERNLVWTEAIQIGLSIADREGRFALEVAKRAFEESLVRSNVREVRNKIIAHLDRAVVLGQVRLPDSDIWDVGTVVRVLGSMRCRLEAVIDSRPVSVPARENAHQDPADQERRNDELARLAALVPRSQSAAAVTDV
ncbi:MAG: hypothetical protein EPO68_12445 [Planctomycetota bacterium]|nr:MAG: hypothetical protein EPO68_12445 [Planctomycetota bacterium]